MAKQYTEAEIINLLNTPRSQLTPGELEVRDILVERVKLAYSQIKALSLEFTSQTSHLTKEEYNAKTSAIFKQNNLDYSFLTEVNLKSLTKPNMLARTKLAELASDIALEVELTTSTEAAMFGQLMAMALTDDRVADMLKSQAPLDAATLGAVNEKTVVDAADLN
jgi:hypothetical protein